MSSAGPLGVFDWCRPGDPEHARCKITYRRHDGSWRVCSCPGHSPAEIAARKTALTPCTMPERPAK